MSRVDTVGIFGVHDGEWKAAKVDAAGKLETTTTFGGTGFSTEEKQDDQILELQSMVTALNSIDTEVLNNGVTQSNIDFSTSNIDGKITVGEDDTLVGAQQVLIYGRKDDSPSGLRALKVLDNGALNVNDNTLISKISKGSDISLVEAQQVLCYGRDSAGSLDALKTDTQGRLEIVSSSAEPVLTPYTSFINNATLAANTQSTQTIDMTGYRNIQIVGQTGSANDKLGFAFYDGVSAWRSDGVQAGIFYDGTVNHFSLILSDIGASSIKIENLQNQAIANLYVSVYRY